jgi:hypothetical protein
MSTPASAVPRYVAFMRIIVSLIVLIVGLAVLTSPNFIFPTKLDEAAQKIAAG